MVVRNVIVMSSEGVWRCWEEVSREEFSRVGFLRQLAQACPLEEHRQMLLAIYAYYQLVHLGSTRDSLATMEKGLALQEESVGAALLLALRAALLTAISKHTEALLSFKEALQTLHRIDHNHHQLHPLHKRIFPAFAAKIIHSFNFARGRREFLVLLDEIKGEAQAVPSLQPVMQAVNGRMGQIRESMRCAGKSEHERKLLMSSSSMGVLGQRQEEAESSTSIYINRLYEERRKTLGQRDRSSGFGKAGKVGSGLGKTGSSNPYQLALREERPAECFLM